MGMCKNYCKTYGGYAVFLFRILFGFLFFMHGWAKFSGGTPSGLMLAAGIIELVVGTVVFLGLFTRLAAALGAAQMLIALFIVHFPNGWNPLANGGEPAVLFFAGFLALTVLGNGQWSLEHVLLKKEVF